MANVPNVAKEPTREEIENQRIIQLNPKDPEPFLIGRAAEVIKSGGTVVFPTETVYGIGANGLDPKAVEKIFEAKGRPSDNPLILHIGKAEHIEKLGEDLSPAVKRLADAFWPGPLTMIVKKKEIVPNAVTAGLDTVAIRCPSDPIAHTLIQMAGYPIAAPSANLSGSPSPTTGAHVLKDMSGRVDLILISNDAGIGVESTVVDMTGDIPLILRPGHITRNEIALVAGACDLSEALLQQTQPERPASPGLKYTHYKPHAKLLLAESEKKDTATSYLASSELKSALISLGERPDDLPVDISFFSAGQSREDYERNLFKILRALDECEIKEAVVILPEEGEETLAVRDRLYHAAGYKFLQ